MSTVKQLLSTQQLAPVPSVRASTRRRRKQQRPGEIIEAALQEFARRGFAATRLEDVAELAGVTKGTIYFYFKDKEELFKAAARTSLEPALSEIEALAAHLEGSAEELLCARLSGMYNEMVKNPRVVQILRLLIAEGAQFPELVEFYYREVVSHGMNILSRIVERGVSRNEFRRSRVAEFPQLIFGPVLAAMIWSLLFAARHPIDFDEYGRAHLDLMLNGLKALKPNRS